jgi:hypothetical protein
LSGKLDSGAQQALLVASGLGGVSQCRMSSALRPTQLLWNGHVGLAKHEGVSVEFSIWPAAALPGVQVLSMRYVPSHHDFEVVEAVVGPRPLTQAEKASCYTLLKNVVAASRDALLGT